MEVILLRDVKGQGKEGEVIKVSDGYARNFLLPKGYAILATEGGKKKIKEQTARLLQKRQSEKEKATRLARRISDVKVELKVKAGENGKLFGSVTGKDIAEALEKQHKITVDKKKIVMPEPIKNIGDFEVEIKIYPEVTARLTVGISAE
jgi:large subunit ribosomal protein L9